MKIRPEQSADRANIRHLLREAFGGDAEADLVDALRTGPWIALSLVAEAEGWIVGYVAFSDIAIQNEDGSVPSLALAPMAVAKPRQRSGIGSTLVKEGLRRLREEGRPSVVVLGHPEYYPRFGFSAKLAETLDCPFHNGPALMALELIPGALRGVRGALRYAPPFAQL